MAAITIRVRARERVVVVDVAVGAGVHLACRRQLMRTKERPTRGAVIEGSRQERDGVVAVGAICGHKRCARGRVHRIVRSLPASPVIRI